MAPARRRGPWRPLTAGPAAASPRPPLANDPVELRLARAAIGTVMLVAVPVIAVAAAVAGAGGALGAGIATAVVAGMLVMSGTMMSAAAPLGPAALLAAALGGYLLRLMIYAALILLLRPVESLHGPSLAIGAAVLLIVALLREAQVASRTPGLFWVDPGARRAAGQAGEQGSGDATLVYSGANGQHPHPNAAAPASSEKRTSL